jgi:hypothetical protein
LILVVAHDHPTPTPYRFGRLFFIVGMADGRWGRRNGYDVN